MLNIEIFKTLEQSRWSLVHDVDWNKFDRRLISERQLHGIKMNAILEWSSLPTSKMFLRDGDNDMDFSSFISIWFFEEQKHSLVLIEYLKRFAPEYMPTLEELKKVDFKFDEAPLEESIMLNYCGEVRLSNWYKCARDYYREPVIRQIYKYIQQDEVRHASSYLKYMKQMYQKEQSVKEKFVKIGLLMTNYKLKKAMHPTNLHVNKELYPLDTVNSRLPDPDWIELWLNQEINFDKYWERKVENMILRGLSKILNIDNLSRSKLKNIYQEDK